MHIGIVTSRLDGLTDERYRQQAQATAPAFAQWPGLNAKFWLADPDTAPTYGGVYLFTSNADASRSTKPFHAMTTNPRFIDLSIREFNAIDAATAIATSATIPLTAQRTKGGSCAHTTTSSTIRCCRDLARPTGRQSARKLAAWLPPEQRRITQCSRTSTPSARPTGGARPPAAVRGSHRSRQPRNPRTQHPSE